MNVLLFGATGMVGQGVLRECLRAADVELVQTVGRSITGEQHPKLRELAHKDLWDYRAMVGLVVNSTAKVDALHAKALKVGGTDEGAPGARGEGFYAGYFRDLDGNKLNCFCAG